MEGVIADPVGTALRPRAEEFVGVLEIAAVDDY